METKVLEAQPRGSAEFVESSVLEAVVPASPNIDIKQELISWDGVVKDESGSILPFLSQRQVVLLDELLSVFVVFRTPLLGDELLNTYLARLLVNVEAYAFSTAPPPEDQAKTAPPKELIHSDTIKESNKPTIVRHGDEADSYTYVIWKVDIFIARPQGRFHKPAVYFQPTASFKPAEKPKKDVFEDEYLPSRVPTALNLLQSFENDPALAGVHPRLSAMRINKITPSASVAREMVRPIRNGQRPIFRIIPALIWRMRYSHLPTSMSDVSLMASLDVEIASFTAYDVRIDKVDLSLHGGKVKAIANTGDATTMHKPGDQLTYVYKIKPDHGPDGFPALRDKGHFLTLRINANVSMSEVCQPNIAIEWQTPVEFTSGQQSSLVKSPHRISNSAAQDLKIASPDALPAHDMQTQLEQDSAENNNINVTLTVTGPPKVRVGKIFTWDVFIVNRSQKTRKLAILVIAKRKREYDKHSSHLSTSSAGAIRDKTELLASAVLDENIVYAKQKSARTETAELICLTTDIRLGSLSPGSCYTADLKFLALSAGVLSVEAVRIVDLATNETADVRDLPSIIAVKEED